MRLILIILLTLYVGNAKAVQVYSCGRDPDFIYDCRPISNDFPVYYNSEEIPEYQPQDQQEDSDTDEIDLYLNTIEQLNNKLKSSRGW